RSVTFTCTDRGDPARHHDHRDPCTRNPTRRLAQLASSARVVFSLADSAVDRLAQQVGVAVVARVLLDHVGEDPPEGDGTVVGMVEAPVERLALGDDAPGMIDL